jgi:hypothetical protein
MAAKAAIHVFFVGFASKKKEVVDGGLRRHDGVDGSRAAPLCISQSAY